MKMFWKACTMVLAACVLPAGFALPVQSSAAPGLSPEDAKQIMQVSQLKRGMRGYGLTVFQGTTIEKFDLEILGVLPKMNTGRDLILVRIGGGPITGRQTNIVAGMSGSPCYIEGKLIGALSAGFPFSKEPVGLVTPIVDMLEAWDSNLPAAPSGYSSPQSLPNPLMIDGKEVRSIVVDKPGQMNPGYENGVLRLRPLMTPLMVTGLSSRGMGRLAEVLRPFGIEPMAGPGASPVAGVKAGLEPGAAVGISLARGDIDMTAIGTVTYRRGNRILAMGHPFLGVGAIDAPMTTAFVADLVPQYLMSTKLGAPIEVVGRVFQDRPWSVAGAVGSASKTIPAVIRVNDEAYNRTRTFRVQAINHPLIAAGILTAVVGEAIYQAHPSPGDATAQVAYEVVADRVGRITRSNVFFDQVSVDDAAVSDLGALLSLLSRNRFHPLDIKSVNVVVNIRAKRETANVERIFVKKNDFEPGELMEVGVELRPFKQPRLTRTFSITIPPDAPDGRVTLQVRGGASPFAATSSSPASGPEGGPSAVAGISDLSSADNVKQLVSKYLEREKNTDLVVRLILPTAAVSVAGEKLTGLPDAIAGVMKSSRSSALRLERDEHKEVFDTGAIVYGSQQITVNIKRKDLREKKPTARPVPTPASESTEPQAETRPVSSSGEPERTMMDLAASLPAADEPEEDDSETDADAQGSSAVVEEVGEEETVPEAPPAKPARPEAEPKPAETKRDVKTVVRQPKTWTQQTQSDFARGQFFGTAASSDNKLEPAPVISKIAETSEQFVWDLAPADNGVYAATGSSGRVYHIADDGRTKVFFETGEILVNALAVDKAGCLYAGTSPNGRVFKISPDGRGEQVFKADERHVTALACDAQGSVYVGVGDAGRIYVIGADGTARLFAELTERQVLSLALDPDGALLIGTGPNGILYRADRSGNTSPLFDADEEAITAIVCDGARNIYAATSSRGSVYRIKPDGEGKRVAAAAGRILALARDSQDNVYAAHETGILKITPDERVLPIDSSRDGAQFISLLYKENGQSLYAGTGNVGAVYQAKLAHTSGKFESAVHDAGMISRWAKIKWVADIPEGTSVQVRTRTGNVPFPDHSWSPWSEPYVNPKGDQVAGGDARYIQYQVTFGSDKPGASARLASVSISYLTPNQPPKVEITSPKPGEVWAGKKTITWTASDPDKDTLTYDVYYSSDGGKQWKALAGGVKSGANSAPAKSAEEITAKITSELKKSEDVPEEMKQAVLQERPRPSQAPAAETKAPPAQAPSTRTSFDFDTASVPDGTYIIKVVASDRSSNAVGALTDEAVGSPFTVCNKPPKISVHKSRIQATASGSATIAGWVSAAAADIVGVQFRVDSGSWTAAKADDGVFDSPLEDFTVETDALPAGKHKIELQAIDAAGNASGGTYEVTVK